MTKENSSYFGATVCLLKKQLFDPYQYADCRKIYDLEHLPLK